ncbi:MAG TPA: methyltransferase domain-containing protein [Rhodocyclaceae bacterium]|nr:methyltransferase domain-containing protein [Rhodocyclaceae bacterium]
MVSPDPAIVRCCIVCSHELEPGSLSFDDLPVCNDFSMQTDVSSRTHRLEMSVCAQCGLVQLSDFPDADLIRPRLPWIAYNEPGVHLDALSRQIAGRLGLQAESLVLGLGCFDAPLLDRFRLAGMWVDDIDLRAEAGFAAQDSGASYPYLETLQGLLRSQVLEPVTKRTGAADLVCCRYLLEHCADPIGALKAMAAMTRKGGALFIEVPDASKFLARCDYSFIWEEHVSYFTEDSLTACMQAAGLRVLECIRINGALEDALAVLLVKDDSADTRRVVLRDSAESSVVRFEHYRQAFPAIQARYHELLDRRRQDGDIAVFGAGHQAIMFVNALGLQTFFSCVVDDAPNKLDYRIPGPRIPIVRSSVLCDADTLIRTCLLTVNPNVERRVMENCAAFRKRGGSWFSIFPSSSSPTLLNMAGQ